MSRIQEILRKAEREGALHRTRTVLAEPTGAAIAERPIVPIERTVVVERPFGAPADLPADIDSYSPAAAVPAVRETAGSLDRLLVAALAPHSPAAEHYRSLRTRVARAEHGRTMRSILITSPNKGDGKSLTAANLALTMAQEFQHRVLLVDGDLRRPTIHSLFGIDSTPGLSDVLMGGATIDEALVAIADHRLTILPSGLIPNHPAELLGSSSMRRVLDTLRARFDRIIVDMPPVAPLADVAIASTLADGVLMIVRAGVTPKPAIERALSGVEASKVLGLVLNDAGDLSAPYRYEGYRYVAG